MTELIQESAQIAEFSATDARLNELRDQYAVIPNADTKEGYEALRLGIRDIVRCRTSLEAKRQEVNAPLLAKTKLANSEAKRITAELVKIEEPMKAAKGIVDERKRLAKEEAERVELARIKGIEKAIAYFPWVVKNTIAANYPASKIGKVISEAAGIQITADAYQEFVDEAKEAQLSAVGELTRLYEATKEREDEAARLKADKEKLDAERAELDKQRKIEQEKTKREWAELEEKRKVEQEKRDEDQAEGRRLREEIRKLKREAEEAKKAAAVPVVPVPAIPATVPEKTIVIDATDIVPIATPEEQANRLYEILKAESIKEMDCYDGMDALFSAIESGNIPHITFDAVKEA